MSMTTPRYGMDHERYAWSLMERRAPVRWPGGRPLALWINVSLEHFPLNPRGEGFKAPGSMSMPYPDLRHYTFATMATASVCSACCRCWKRPQCSSVWR